MRKKSALFKDLGVAFYPVGSVVEGTRVGITNEADCMVRFHALDGHLRIKSATDIEVSGRLKHTLIESKKLALKKLYCNFIREVKAAIQAINIEGSPVHITFDVCQHEDCKVTTECGALFRYT